MRPLLHALHRYALLAATVAVGLAMIDAVTRTEDRQRAAPPERATAPAHGGSGRVFVFIVDSLRYETAVDPAIMPNLVRLCEQGAWARVIPTREAITVPSFRAAFTGRDRFTVFSFAENLWHREGRHSSVFTQLAEAGRQTCSWSDGSMKQFSADLAQRHTVGMGEGTRAARQNASVLASLEAFLSGDCDTVISHVNYADRTAHQVGEQTGIDHPEYRRVFGIVDDMIGLLDERLGPEHTLLVIGDHGHDRRGRHLMGLDVPTLGVIRGAGYARGVDLGTIPIQDTRALMSWGLKLPADPDDEGGRHPEAYAPAGALPAGYDVPFDALAAQRDVGSGVPPQRRAAYLTALLAVCAMAGLWLRIAWSGDAGPWRALAAWVALALALAGWPAAGGVVALAALAWPGRGAARPGLWAAAAGVALALAGWGALLASAREQIHYPPYALLAGLWVPVLAAGAVAARRFGAMRATWALFVVAGGLLYPSVYRYGAPATMVPVWAACLLFALVEDWRWPPRRLLLLGAAIGFLAPFAIVNSVQFQFERWMVFDVFLWGSRRAEHAAAPGLALALAAKLVILVPRRGGWPSRAVAVVLALGLLAVESGWIYGLGVAGRTGPLLGALAVLGAAAVVRARGGASGETRHVARVLLIGGLLLLYCTSVRVQPAAYLWLECLLAALVLSSRYLAEEVRIRDQGGVYAFCLLMALLLTGWTGMAWTVHRFEWGILYEWIDAAFVETKAGLFLPFILGRYLIPLVIARLLLAEVFAGRFEYPHRWIPTLAGVKTLSLLLITWGIALHLVRTDVFSEALLQTSLWTLLSFVLFWPGGGKKGTEAPRH